MTGSEQSAGTAVRIVQLYPQELGVTGDRGNVRALETRLERAGIPVEVVPVGIGDALPEQLDVIVIGNGPLSAMRGVHADLAERRARLHAEIEAGAVLLAVGAGAELLSGGVALLDGEEVAGLGLLPFRVERTRQRRVGYLIAETEHGRLIGFEDHASTWHLEDGATPYGAVSSGKGTFPHGTGRGESVRARNAFATNVQGPVLPLNPQLSDALLRIVAERRGLSYGVGEGHEALDRLAAGARAAIEERVDGEVFTYMQV